MSVEAFAEAYQAAIYKAGGLAFVLSEKPTGVVLFKGRRFAIITAHNPRSERFSSEENQKRHEQLEQDLKMLGLEYTFSTGESPDGTWIEEGFAVFDVGLEEALELGRKYGQHAILWGEGEKVCLAWCESKELKNFYVRDRGTIPGELYESINVYRRINDDRVAIYRCLRLLSGRGYVVQNKSWYYDRQLSIEHRNSVDYWFLDLLISSPPEERQGVYRTLQEAIRAFDESFGEA